MNAYIACLAAYLIATTTGLFYCFLLQPGRTRIVVRAITFLLVTPIAILLLAIVAFGVYIEVQGPPSMSSLESHFHEKRADLEKLVILSNQDEHFTRIAPGFLDQDSAVGKEGRFMEDDPNVKLSNARWNIYRSLYKANGIDLGLQRDTAGDIFIMLGSIGLLERGHTSGYLYCNPSEQVMQAPERFEPCVRKRKEGEHLFDPNIPNEEGYKFHQLDTYWYAYDSGPG